MTQTLQDCQQALDEAQQENQYLKKHRDIFLSGLAHDLRAPMASLLTQVDVLNTGAYGYLNTEQLHALTKIRQYGQDLLDLCIEVSDLAKAEVGQLPLTLYALSVNELQRHGRHLLKESVQKKHIQLQAENVNPDLFVQGDTRKLQQMLNYLLFNAVAYTPPDGRIAINIQASDNWVQWSIEDSGQPLDMALSAQDFTPYLVLSSNDIYDTEHRHSDMGLNLAKKIADLHGGKLEAFNLPQQGVRFSLKLPRTSLDEVKTNDLVLFYSTDPIMAQSYASTLNTCACMIKLVFNASLVISLTRQLQPQVLIFHIPENITKAQEIFQQLKQLKNSPRLEAMPVILLLSKVMDLPAFLHNTVTVLSLPVSDAALLQQVKPFLNT
ncbi:HAMP domain-containing sensor histidine kinase [Candidatus Venteria ishoeyi]|uniref:sensor histidine kinase n=1 Tax=Candidatus Venteria ishoeyi TaxID=1899563 RepID=UPI0025A5225F|nr:HAMP domain-containing sensor histidine kinase [Candidatus Venteria ishoeyi]MDM8546839.1 HAMP domain-containing sensor histidine kinase [Candidatus Venteria ishoeyi]